MQQCLSFNEALPGGGRFTVPCYPATESDEVQSALLEPMPLRRAWAFWEQMSTGGYDTRKVVSFSTAQEFWSVWNGMPQPSELLDGKRLMRDHLAIDALMIFQDGINPEWEDPANDKGGHFQLQLKPPSGGAQIDEYWNNLVLAMVGETLDGDSGNMITGVRLVDKISVKGKVTDCIRIEVWYHSNTTNSQVNILKRNLEKCLVTRIDGSLGAAFKGDAIQDKKHHSQNSK